MTPLTIVRPMFISVPLILICAVSGILPAQTLKVVEPKEGTVVHPGQTFTVVVEASPTTASFQAVSIVGGRAIGFSKMLFAPPYRFSIFVPPDTQPRRYSLSAVGVIEPGKPIWSEPIQVLAERADSPLSLTTEPSVLIFQHVGDECPLDVVGRFVDVERVDLHESHYVEYTSDNPGVASVTRDGHVKATGPGLANITIRYENKFAVVPVTVRKARPDQN